MTKPNLDKNLKRPYSVEPYNPRWADLFEEIKSELKNVFKDKALEIEHIGSTSIPGMKAKPVIDVLVVVDHIETFEEEKKEMKKLGYKWSDNYITPDTIIFFKEDDEQRKTENIHVYPKNSYKAKQFLAKRDYLKNHPDIARQYADLKEELSKKYPDDYPAYREGKKEFLKSLDDPAYLMWEEND